MNKPTLYILARTDLTSMNPGKMAAQACHAANAFIGKYHIFNGEGLYNDGVLDWIHSTPQYFGTTIVLDAKNLTTIQDIVSRYQNADMPADIVLDPSYPVRDGSVTHLLPLETCGYVFIDRDNPSHKSVLDSYDLKLYQ